MPIDGDMSGEPASADDVLGTWIAKPALGQLGLTQSTYSFRDDGTFSWKLDFISFCDGCNRGIDCDYFWNVHEGRYADEDGVFTFNIEQARRLIQHTGHAEPEIAEDSPNPRSYHLLIEVQEDILIFRDPKTDRVSVLRREY